MNIISGNIWDCWKKPLHSLVVTTNQVIWQGKLVMGAGIAKEAKIRFPDLPKLMGLAIAGMTEPYYLIECPQQIVCLQTKIDWRKPSPLDLVEESVKRLGILAEKNRSRVYNLPRPACGMGGRSWEKEIKPICKKYLGSNCFVWSKN